ncbi:MAG: MOSC domain-containing protein [Paracoccaceae bacterium]
MPALLPTAITGTIVWLGRVADRDTALASAAVTELRLTFAGPEGEAHGGLTRPSDSRVTAQYPEGTEVRNVRQLSILSAEELDETAARMGLAALDPGLVGATMLVRGIPDFSHLPPSSRLQAGGGATLVIDMQNRPCMLAGRSVGAHHPGYGPKFKPAAEGRRGVTAWVEREGTVRVGEAVRLHIPDQRVWAPLSAHLEDGRG